MLNRYPTWSVAGVNLFESQVLVFCYYTPMLALMLQSYVLKRKGARRLWWSTRLNSLIHIITACRGTSTTPGCGLFAADIREHGKGRFAAVSKKMNLRGLDQDEFHQFFTHGPSNFLLEWGLWNGMVSQSKTIQLSIIQVYMQQFQQRKQNQSVLLVAKALDPFALSRDDPDARMFRTRSSPWSIA